ncbi:hypothetical protein M426DRAFT_325844 [Hypoxylon sp. CI-4A]|nr:hypothetical protein M426DRAFT_325844 [Hypoxylon sp. CI-4A]
MSSVLSNKDVNAPVQTQEAVAAANNGKPTGAQSLEYHRQVLESKMAEEKYGATVPESNSTTPKISTQMDNTVTVPTMTTTETATKDAASPVKSPHADINAAPARQQQYVSPSDNIMSPCTAKLSAFKGRAASRAKPKSLFAQASSKKFSGENLFGAKDAPSASASEDPFTTKPSQ